MGRRICCRKLGTTARGFAKTPSRGCQCCYRHTQSSSGTRYAPAINFNASPASGQAWLTLHASKLHTAPFNLFMQLVMYLDLLACSEQAGAVVEKLAEHMVDTDAGARAALRDLLKDVVLPRLGAGGLAPFLPLLMAHITSAMTHLTAAVRWALLSLCKSVT